MKGAALLLSLMLATAAGAAGSTGVRVLASSDAEVLLAIELPVQWLSWSEVDGPRAARLSLPGAVHPEPGVPDVPYLAELLAAPAGSRIELEVEEGEAVEVTGVELLPVRAEPDDQTSATTDAPTDPSVRASVTRLGILRGVETWALHLRPFAYDPARRVVRTFPDLKVRARFVGGARARPGQGPTHPLHRVFLNAAQAGSFTAPARAAKPAATGWNDPSRPWLKVHVTTDGLFRLDPEWLRPYLDPETVDPRTFRLFWRGEEQPLYVRGEADGRFDSDDRILFHGRYRRDDRDFTSLYGPRNTYWLTWGGPPGRRFTERAVAPNAGFPAQGTFADTAHFEQDLDYDPLPYAPDQNRDHWFWRQVSGTHPTIPGSSSFTGDLVGVELGASATIGLRVSLHGVTDMGHHTVVKLNDGPALIDTVWGAVGSGQVGVVAAVQVPASRVTRGVNRLLVQVLADQAKVDWTYLDWFEIGYRRRYETVGGILEFAQEPSTGHRITVTGLRDPRVELFDVANGVRLTGLAVDSTAVGVRATFEDRTEEPATYVIADSAALQVPRGEVEVPSSWRQPANGADYVVIAPPANLDGALALAAHRQADGLRTAVVSTDDLYDEFTFGRMDVDAVAQFIRYAYHEWQVPPGFVLLYGDDTHDYRGILGAGVPASVPGPYYQSRGRGLAPSDFLLSLVDGEDLLPDLAIGRLPVSGSHEAAQVAEKVIGYDRDPEPGPWRDRVLYLANWHEKGIFTAPCDSLAAHYTEPAGLTSVRVYSPDESPIPNATGRTFLNAFNAGAVLMNFSGHGSAGALQYVFVLDLSEWGYLAQIQNGRRLPLVLAMSCLNGKFTDPAVESLAEAFTTLPEAGAIAYISATAKSFVAQNDLLSELVYDEFFAQRVRTFGPALLAAKIRLLAAHPGWEDAALTMQLFGDPAQELALPAGPDLAVESLRTVPAEVFGQSTVAVEAALRQVGRAPEDSLRILLLGRAAASTLAETLATAVMPPFAGERALRLSWPVGARRGEYLLELRVDPGDAATDIDETNDTASLTVTILDPLVAELVYPAPGSVVAATDLRLEAAVPLHGGPYSCQFEVATEPGFGADTTERSPWVPAQDGLAAYADVAPRTGGPRFWRVRLSTPAGEGIWGEARSFLIADAAAPGTWEQQGAQLLPALSSGLMLREGRLRLTDEPLPCRPSAATRDTGFTVRDLAGVGVLCTDGVYIYAKRWFNDRSTVYPGNDLLTRVGSGLNGTYQSANFGPIADTTTAGISATYHGDGFIYSECGRAFQLERVSPVTGKLDTVAVPDGLIEWKTGRVIDGHALITSDGRLVYNVAMSSPVGARAEWLIRVFDPGAGWSLVREFTSPPTETGFTYEWTDGILADGRRLYLIEYGGQHRIRMIDAVDGRFLDEWTSDQAETRIISGQYDWVNNKIWLGDLFGSAIYRYQGQGQVDSASVLSEPIGPASRWGQVRVAGTATTPGLLAVDLLAAEGTAWAVVPGKEGLVPGTTVDLSELDPERYPRLRLRARLSGGLEGAASLDSWAVDYTPRRSLQLAAGEGTAGEAGLEVALTVRNLSPFEVAGAKVVLARGDGVGGTREFILPTLRRGATVQVRVDSVKAPPSGVRLFATLSAPGLDVDPGDDRREVLLLGDDRAPVTAQVWPEGGQYLSGDPLRPDQGLVLAAPELTGAELSLRFDGAPAEPDSLLDPFPETGPRVLFRPRAEAGMHRLEIQVRRAAEELGRRRLDLRVTPGLALGKVLVYPHPVREGTALTCVLSEPAEVTVHLYTLSGRLVRSLGPVALEAGFVAMPWDGRDEDDEPVASGTYLYVLRARAGSEEVVARGPVVVVR